MLEGTIASKVEQKGFGFIHPKAGGEDLFFHRSALAGDFDALQVGQNVSYTVDTAAPKARAKSVTPGSKPAAGRSRLLSTRPGRSPARGKPRPSAAKVEFGFVTKLHRKNKQGFISANGGGQELLFEAFNVSGEKPYYRLQVGDYVQFTRHAALTELDPPIAKCVQATERKVRIETGLELPNHPKARRRKPTWR